MVDDVKVKTVEWLYQQGVSTILLFMIFIALCYGSYHMIPEHLDQIQRGYQKHAEELTKTVTVITESRERDRDMYEKDRDLFLDIMFKERTKTINQKE